MISLESRIKRDNPDSEPETRDYLVIPSSFRALSRKL